jgi:hypothetical protein
MDQSDQRQTNNAPCNHSQHITECLFLGRIRLVDHDLEQQIQDRNKELGLPILVDIS